MPCMDCARAIVQSGISELVVDDSRMRAYSSDFYDPHFRMAEVLLTEAKVRVRLIRGDTEDRPPA